jgi:hypothetical protein
MRLSVFEHENMLTTTDFIFSSLRLQVKREYYIILEGHIFERMTQVASTGQQPSGRARGSVEFMLEGRQRRRDQRQQAVGQTGERQHRECNPVRRVL